MKSVKGYEYPKMGHILGLDGLITEDGRKYWQWHDTKVQNKTYSQSIKQHDKSCMKKVANDYLAVTLSGIKVTNGWRELPYYAIIRLCTLLCLKNYILKYIINGKRK